MKSTEKEDRESYIARIAATMITGRLGKDPLFAGQRQHDINGVKRFVVNTINVLFSHHTKGDNVDIGHLSDAQSIRIVTAFIDAIDAQAITRHIGDPYVSYRFREIKSEASHYCASLQKPPTTPPPSAPFLHHHAKKEDGTDAPSIEERIIIEATRAIIARRAATQLNDTYRVYDKPNEEIATIRTLADLISQTPSGIIEETRTTGSPYSRALYTAVGVEDPSRTYCARCEAKDIGGVIYDERALVMHRERKGETALTDTDFTKPEGRMAYATDALVKMVSITVPTKNSTGQAKGLRSSDFIEDGVTTGLTERMLMTLIANPSMFKPGIESEDAVVARFGKHESATKWNTGRFDRVLNRPRPPLEFVPPHALTELRGYSCIPYDVVAAHAPGSASRDTLLGRLYNRHARAFGLAAEPIPTSPPANAGAGELPATARATNARSRPSALVMTPAVAEAGKWRNTLFEHDKTNGKDPEYHALHAAAEAAAQAASTLTDQRMVALVNKAAEDAYHAYKGRTGERTPSSPRVDAEGPASRSGTPERRSSTVEVAADASPNTAATSTTTKTDDPLVSPTTDIGTAGRAPSPKPIVTSGAPAIHAAATGAGKGGTSRGSGFYAPAGKMATVTLKT